MRFKLLAGQHVGEDFDAKPHPVTGERPPRTFDVGAEIVTDTDLIAKFGHQKFARVDEPRPVNRQPGDPSAEIERRGISSAPGGQVGTGMQQAQTDPIAKDNAVASTKLERTNEQVERGLNPFVDNERTKSDALDKYFADLEKLDDAELREHAAAEEVDTEGVDRAGLIARFRKKHGR